MLLEGALDERTRRLVAAAEALTLGWGGVTAVAKATGVSRRAIQQGIQELQDPEPFRPGRVRKPGGGRKTTVSQDSTLLRDLESLVEPVTRGDPESPLRWTCKSLRKLAAELQQQGHRVSHVLVGGTVAHAGVPLVGQPQDAGRVRPSGPGCPVRVAGPAGTSIPGCR